MSVLSRFRRPWLTLAALAMLVAAGLLIHRQVQNALGRRALAATQLASTPLPAALAAAQAAGKLVLVEVAALWCPSCRRLDAEVFTHPEVRRRLRTDFIFTRLDYESAEGRAFTAARGVRSFPTLWLLDGEGRVVRQLELTFAPEAFLAQLPGAAG